MVMPTGFYEIMTERDLDAMVAYLRTIKPIKNKVPDPIYKMPQVHRSFPGGEKPYTEAMMSDKLKKGFYLATIAHCMECHTPMGPRGRDFATKLGTGGFEFPGPVGRLGVAQHHLEQDQGHRRLDRRRDQARHHHGVSKDGSKLKPPMGFHSYAMHDRRRSRRRRGLAAHGAGEGVAL